MQEVGEVLHTARSGRIILRLETEVPAGTVLVDEKGRNAAKVMELMGPSQALRLRNTRLLEVRNEGTEGLHVRVRQTVMWETRAEEGLFSIYCLDCGSKLIGDSERGDRSAPVAVLSRTPARLRDQNGRRWTWRRRARGSA